MSQLTIEKKKIKKPKIITEKMLKDIISRITKGNWTKCGASKGKCECGYIFGDKGQVFVAKTQSLYDDVDPVGSKEMRLANAELIEIAPQLAKLVLKNMKARS